MRIWTIWPTSSQHVVWFCQCSLSKWICWWKLEMYLLSAATNFTWMSEKRTRCPCAEIKESSANSDWEASWSRFVSGGVFVLLGVHTCFVCKKRSEDVRRCMIPVCGKFYHGECIANYAPTAPVNRGFRCSIHVCLTCFIASPNSSSISKGKPRTDVLQQVDALRSDSLLSPVRTQVVWCDAFAARWRTTPRTCAWRRAAWCCPTTASSVPTTSPPAAASRTTNMLTSAGASSAPKVKRLI